MMKIFCTLLFASVLMACSGGDDGVAIITDQEDSNPDAFNSFTVSWMPPTTNTDDSSLTDLAGYKVYYGLESGNYSEAVDVPGAGLSEAIVENVPVGTYYLVMTAYNESNTESAFSEEVELVVSE